jgi:exopolysaccharide biosynthesis WecB/TagA/CpsF family protein
LNPHSAQSAIRLPAGKSILGMSVASIGWSDAIELLGRLVEERLFTKIGFMNAHNANTACVNADFRAAMQHFLLLPDGIGVDIAARLLHGAKFPANLNGTDFVPGFLHAERRPMKVGLIGSRRENAETAARKLKAMAPQHEVFVVSDGFFTPADEPAILADLKARRPDVLLVAMGTPRQELWIERNLNAAHCTLPIAVGALLDFLGGAVPRAPGWMRTMRLEWMFRLSIEPRRLWRRYIVGNPVFLLRILRQKLASRGAAA